MTMYLQKNYNGTFAVSMKNEFRDSEMFKGIDYIVIIDNLPKTMTMKGLYEMLQKDYGCRKLVLDF